jgi:transposase
MRTQGSPDELERRRRLAVRRVSQGYDCVEVAEFLGVHPASVRKWWNAHQQAGDAGLVAKPATGRPPKLTPLQETEVLCWLGESPKSFGFATELWTAKRVAQLIEHEWDVHFHPHYLSAWLADRNVTPQKPQRRARERDNEAIRRWRIYKWPRIQNARVTWVLIWFLSTKAGYS